MTGTGQGNHPERPFMPITVGDKLPEATLAIQTTEGPRQVHLSEILPGRKVVIFAVPGAFTPTCDSAHVPSFIRVAKQLREKGVDAIYCVAVNDTHVMRHWGNSTGATEAGIVMLSDANGEFARFTGVKPDEPATGMYGRNKRYSILVEDGVVTIHNPEPAGGCAISGGEHMLEQL
jgi:glutaredoxin/glutathione-dependent peroxiredoxin